MPGERVTLHLDVMRLQVASCSHHFLRVRMPAFRLKLAPIERQGRRIKQVEELVGEHLVLVGKDAGLLVAGNILKDKAACCKVKLVANLADPHPLAA